MPTTFLTGPDWQSSSGPLIIRNVHEDDCWPHSVSVANKVALADGAHVALGIGPVGNTQHLHPVGVLVSYNATSKRCAINLAPGFMFKAYVTNVTGYAGANTPNAWGATLVVGQTVYLDHSVVAGFTGTNLSLSAADDGANTNPRAGIVMPDQDEDIDTGIGGANADAFPKSFTDNTSTHELLVTVMLWPDAF